MQRSIREFCDSSSPKFGRLLNWQNPNDPFWHYGIGLSNDHIFDTGRGMQVFESSRGKHVIGVEHIAFSPGKTVARLEYAVEFFGSWEYNVLGWNCEHLARLVATGEARCYQSAPLWTLSNLTPSGDHKTAAAIFKDYLTLKSPDLLSR